MGLWLGLGWVFFPPTFLEALNYEAESCVVCVVNQITLVKLNFASVPSIGFMVRPA